MNYEEIIEALKNEEITPEDLAQGDMENPLPIVGDWKDVYSCCVS